ncbi:MAG TPA: DUF5723 family protein [candidate division Zixibacteria bacterium]|nr:conjugal transfer protein TraF [candidate division Zixibacteria bacterium]MDD4918769.1 DUF5723 family protein [candidate division Zixibacteria bacterium]MDM7974298.1 DUF5723 family protein [candidate division Zixibacteria bacterium]HOD66268.1 DUF5723 family protein [candidate division Zixibacteria bacterium]HPI32902.1 DUF5723 family protein [candidate division Zixibacteria bacterium]
MNSHPRTAYLLIPAAAAALLLAPGTPAAAASARGMAMGDAYIGLAAGVDAARYNPANLGLDGHRRSEVEIAGLGLNLTNNAFTLGDYNAYTGAFLTDDDKADLLSKVPPQGLALTADVQASAVSFAQGSFAFSTSGVGQAGVQLSRDLLELVLNGNTFGDSVSITGSYSDAVAYAAAGISYGRALYTAGSRQFAVGGTLKYLRGLAVEQVVELEGLAAAFATGLEGEGRLVARTASGGSGFALDLGAALKISDAYTAGLQVRNLVSRLSWSGTPEEHRYIFSFDTVTVDNMDDDFVVAESGTRSLDPFTTTLPAVLTAGFARTSGKLLWAIDWQQGFRRAAGASTKPRLGLGLESRHLRFLPLRAGFAAGGEQPTAFSFGSGVAAGPLFFDAAVMTGTDLSPYSAKGLNAALSIGLHL